jgi:hypothetical protein
LEHDEPLHHLPHPPSPMREREREKERERERLRRLETGACRCGSLSLAASVSVCVSLSLPLPLSLVAHAACPRLRAFVICWRMSRLRAFVMCWYRACVCLYDRTDEVPPFSSFYTTYTSIVDTPTHQTQLCCTQKLPNTHKTKIYTHRYRPAFQCTLEQAAPRALLFPQR